MARPKKYESEEERRAADAERKRRARSLDVDPDLPERQLGDDVTSSEPAGDRTVELILRLPPDAPLSETEEQAVRDHLGYASSETRSRAERAGVARRIVGQLGPPAESTMAALAELARQEQRYKDKREAYLRSLDKRVPSPS